MFSACFSLIDDGIALWHVHVIDNSVLRARFNIMEEIHKRHKIELDSITQDDDDTFTQGTAASRSTIFTTATSNSNAITQEDMDAFHRALDAKNSDLRYEFDSTKKQHRFDEDAMQREILELQAKKAAIDNGELPIIIFHTTRRYFWICSMTSWGVSLWLFNPKI